MDEFEGLHELVDAFVGLKTSTGDFLELTNRWLLIKEHESDLLEVVHHVQLVHEHLESLHGFLKVLLNDGLLVGHLKVLLLHNLAEVTHVVVKL